MNEFFLCRNGQNVSWKSVCDGYNQCFDGSDEEHCFCQGDVYACLQGNNVSCRLACATYGRVTCITYQNKRACEQYNRELNIKIFNNNSSNESLIFTNYIDGIQYAACLTIGALFVLAIFFILLYFIRKKSFYLLCPCIHIKFNGLSSISEHSSYLRYTSTIDIFDPPPLYSYCEQYSLSIDDLYEPPPYPGPRLFSSVPPSNSIYYETIKTSSMSMLNLLPLPEPFTYSNIRTHSV